MERLFMVWPTLVARMAKGRQAGRQAQHACHSGSVLCKLLSCQLSDSAHGLNAKINNFIAADDKRDTT